MIKPQIFLRGALLCATTFSSAAYAQIPGAPAAPTLPGAMTAVVPLPAMGAMPFKAPYAAPKDVIDKIKDQALNHSQVMETIGYLTDTIGARLTGSPSLKRANEWTRDTLTGYGLKNANLEAWGPFGRGWSLEDFSAEVSSPYVVPLIAIPKAWSPSTNGALNAEAVLFSAATVEDFDKYKGQLRGKIVLISDPRELKPAEGSLTSRLSEAELVELAKPEPPNAGRGFPRPPATPATPAGPGGAPAAVPAPNGGPNAAPNGGPNGGFNRAGIAGRQMVALRRMNFLRDEGAAVVVDNSRQGSGGTLFVQSATVAQDPANLPNFGGPGAPGATAGAPTGPPRQALQAQDVAAADRILPQMTMATEDYNRIARRLAKGEKLMLKVNIATKFYDQDLMCYNTVAEIPGTDLKNEVVMLGAHLDSWHGATGATDNAAGCGVVMEAVRILQTLGLKPRRTIRVALWTGEEEGLFGSTAYVKAHIAEMPPRRRRQDAEPPAPMVRKAEYDAISAYFNLDNGTGKVRGIYAQSNPAVMPIFAQWLQPFAEMGAKTVTPRDTGSTDHIPFDAAGIPAFQFIQDDVEYFTRTHHSNQDNFDRVQADDMKQAAAVMAAFVYQAAMMDEKMPRKPLSP